MAKKTSLLVIFLTVFIDLVGFGIVLPILPLYIKELGASGLIAGAIVASYSLMQAVFSPFWGGLSDRIGRRPVLLLSTAGACISYSVFALGCINQSILLLLLSRVAAGICGANLSVASAYIADITPPEDRSQRMGLIGMAFGLGFILGPVLGALGMTYFGVSGPGWLAAGVCGFNLILAFFILGESRKPDSDPVEPPPRLGQMRRVLGHPQLRGLIGVFFMATFCFTCFESTFAVLFAGTKDSPGNYTFSSPINLKEGERMRSEIYDGLEIRKGEPIAITSQGDSIKASSTGRVEQLKNGGWIIDDTKTKAYWLMAFCGIIGAIVQGGFIGPLVKVAGEKILIISGLFFVGLSLSFIPYCNDKTGLPLLIIVLSIFAIGSGVYRAPTFGLISLNASDSQQGEVMGVTQSIGSLARIIGPLFALGFMDIKPELPYLICSGIAIITALFGFKFIGSTINSASP